MYRFRSDYTFSVGVRMLLVDETVADVRLTDTDNLPPQLSKDSVL